MTHEQIRDKWTKKIKVAIKHLEDPFLETNFIMDLVIYYLYYVIVNNPLTYPKNVP